MILRMTLRVNGTGFLQVESASVKCEFNPFGQAAAFVRSVSEPLTLELNIAFT